MAWLLPVGTFGSSLVLQFSAQVFVSIYSLSLCTLHIYIYYECVCMFFHVYSVHVCVYIYIYVFIHSNVVFQVSVFRYEGLLFGVAAG